MEYAKRELKLKFEFYVICKHYYWVTMEQELSPDLECTETDKGDQMKESEPDHIEYMKTIDRKMRVVKSKSEFYSNVGIYTNSSISGKNTMLNLIQSLKGVKARPARTVGHSIIVSSTTDRSYSTWIKQPCEQIATSAATLLIASDISIQIWVDLIKATSLKYFIVDIVSKKISNVHFIHPRSGGFSEFDIVLCKSSQLLAFSRIVDEIWSRLLIDEVSSIRFSGNIKFPYIIARFMWLIDSNYSSMKDGNVPPGFIKDLVDQPSFWKAIGPFTISCP